MNNETFFSLFVVSMYLTFWMGYYINKLEKRIIKLEEEIKELKK